jgi:hypothetical protein
VVFPLVHNAMAEQTIGTRSALNTLTARRSGIGKIQMMVGVPAPPVPEVLHKVSFTEPATSPAPTHSLTTSDR